MSTDADQPANKPIDFIAYVHRPDAEHWGLEPAPVHREWFHQTMQKAALRCLPLAIANQAGWVVTSPCTFKVNWTSRKPEPETLKVTFPEKEDQQYAGVIKTNFGSGILTIVLPWLFRTSPGYGLIVRGPTNEPKANIVALDGVVETDWSPYPFTMNWKITRPKTDIWFKKGEPLAMLSPFPLNLYESVQPKVVPIQNDIKLTKNFDAAGQSRHIAHTRGDTLEGKFELTYTKGFCPDGEKAPEHRTKLKLKPFE